MLAVAPTGNLGRNKLKAAAGIVVVGVGLLLGSLVLLPKIDVSMNTPNSGNFPSNEQFTFRNDSIYSLRDVVIKMDICEISGKGAYYNEALECDYQHPGGFIFPGWRREWFPPDEEITVSPGEKLKGSLSGINIGFQISYEAWMVPITLHKTFGFKTKTGADGIMYWFAVPVP